MAEDCSGDWNIRLVKREECPILFLLLVRRQKAGFWSGFRWEVARVVMSQVRELVLL